MITSDKITPELILFTIWAIISFFFSYLFLSDIYDITELTIFGGFPILFIIMILGITVGLIATTFGWYFILLQKLKEWSK